MKYTVEKVENGYICLEGEFTAHPKVYVYKSKEELIRFLEVKIK